MPMALALAGADIYAAGDGTHMQLGEWEGKANQSGVAAGSPRTPNNLPNAHWKMHMLEPTAHVFKSDSGSEEATRGV